MFKYGERNYPLGAVWWGSLARHNVSANMWLHRQVVQLPCGSVILSIPGPLD